MTLPHFTVKYKHCSVEELKQFLLQRNGNLPLKFSHRNCIKRLRQLDSEVTFRFLDLAPELRNHIYELYFLDSIPLAIRWSVKKRNTNLLRTSSQMCHEARAVLYDLKTYTLTLDHHLRQIPESVSNGLNAEFCKHPDKLYLLDPAAVAAVQNSIQQRNADLLTVTTSWRGLRHCYEARAVLNDLKIYNLSLEHHMGQFPVSIFSSWLNVTFP